MHPPPPPPEQETEIQRLAALDHAHLWHPFTPMRQWRETEPLIIVAGEGEFLIDARGNRYIDGVSSLWCNVHGHRVPEIDAAIRGQLDRIAHSTLLGLTNVPAVELAAELCRIAPPDLTKVFYSDSGATATEVAFKMAVGYWHHRGQPQRHTFIALSGAYHGDTVGAMSIGYSEVFHRPFRRMVFHTELVPAPVFPRLAATRGGARQWALEDDSACAAARDAALAALESRLREKADHIAAIVIEPLVQGAAGMVMQPPGYLRGVAELAKQFNILLIADEVATGFGRTGRMFACEHEHVAPDILCLGKGITGGYLPLAATLCTDEIATAFEGELHEHRTLYHGHTYTGNPLACAAALASLRLIEQTNLIAETRRKAEILARALDPLRDAQRFPQVIDVRQKGVMVGIELTPKPDAEAKPRSGEPEASGCAPGGSAQGDFGESDGSHPGAGAGAQRRLAYEVCMACRSKGLIIRPLGNTIVLMPPLAIRDENLPRMAEIVVETIAEFA